MNRQVGTPFLKSNFKLFDKQALAADFAQRPIQDLVALGGHAQDVHLAALRTQQVLHVMGLPQGKTAFTGGDGEMNRAQNVVLWAVKLTLNASMAPLMVSPCQSC
jgi:hypothetical protein